ncbi:CinA family protein [Parvibaculum sp.]|uniref:CinA family protein n=1 Tax=Parvibaculum sp. TaxID=2024848 RepID=UPI003C73B87A
MQDLLPVAAEIAELLKKRGETLALSESSMGGLVSASFVAQPGASAFYLGSTVIYTRGAAKALYGLEGAPRPDLKPLTEPYVAVMAERVRGTLNATWALAEMGASGPSGSPYGPPPGTAVIALAGPAPAAITVSTGSADRAANMRAFAQAALRLLRQALSTR